MAIGLFGLGLFVGTIVITGVNLTTNWSDPAKVIGSFISATLAGAVLIFIERVAGSTSTRAIAYYPVGLAYGLIWYYTPAAIRHLGESNIGIQVLGWLHIAGLVASVVLGLLLFLSPGFRGLLPD